MSLIEAIDPISVYMFKVASKFIPLPSKFPDESNCCINPDLIVKPAAMGQGPVVALPPAA